MIILASLVVLYVILLVIVTVLMVRDRTSLGDFARVILGFTVVYGLAALIVGLPIAAATTGIMPNYSNGTRSGYVNKLSIKGLIWKTNEGELQLGAGEAASLQPPFEFSVTNPDVLAKVQAAQESGERVSLTYRQWLVMPFWVGDSRYEIVGVNVPKVKP